MPSFRYKGYKTDGSETAGTIEADGIKDAISRLKDSGLFPKEVKEQTDKDRTFFLKKDDSELLPAVTRQLSILISSGVSLVESLKSLADENQGSWKRNLDIIRERITEGSSLSRAMSEQSELFPEFYVNMVAAGEASGNLSDVLSRLSDFLEKQDEIKRKVKTAMIYPLFMIGVSFVVLFFLFIFVVPKIVRIFEDTKSALPFITVILIFISNFFRNYWWIVLGLVIGGVITFRRIKEKHAIFIDGMIMKLPGNVMQSLFFSRFARTFGFLLNGGLPVLRALELSANAVGNKAVAVKITEAEKKVAEGSSLASSLESFPPTLLQLISTGEKSGKLAEILSRAADAYEDEFSRRIQRALSLLEPLMILGMGLVVGFIVFAVLLPIFQLNQIVR